MSLLSSLIIGRSALKAADAGINTTSHNVANASTPGFHRRRVDYTTADPVRRGRHWYGRGVNTNELVRVANRFVGMRMISQAGDESAASTMYTALSSVEALFDETESQGMRQKLDIFFDSLMTSTADPSDLSLRQGVTFAGEQLARVVRDTGKSLQNSMSDFSTNVKDSLGQVNDKLFEVAAINLRLFTSGGVQAAGDLADQRDQIIQELAEAVGVTVHLGTDGQATVFMGGHAVVSGGAARTLSLDASGTTPKVLVSLDNSSLDVTSSLGGKAGASLETWNLTNGYLDELNTFAKDFSSALNTQHAAGFDQSGTAGGTMFNVIAGQEATTINFDSGLLETPSRLAYAAAVTAEAGDDGNLQALLNLETASIISATATAGQWLSNLTGHVAIDMSRARAIANQEETKLADLHELNHNLSGIDLDEEAGNLIMYQAAYQAAAKVITTSNAMLGTLMQLI